MQVFKVCVIIAFPTDRDSQHRRVSLLCLPASNRSPIREGRASPTCNRRHLPPFERKAASIDKPVPAILLLIPPLGHSGPFRGQRRGRTFHRTGIELKGPDQAKTGPVLPMDLPWALPGHSIEQRRSSDGAATAIHGASRPLDFM